MMLAYFLRSFVVIFAALFVLDEFNTFVKGHQIFCVGIRPCVHGDSPMSWERYIGIKAMFLVFALFFSYIIARNLSKGTSGEGDSS